MSLREPSPSRSLPCGGVSPVVGVMVVGVMVLLGACGSDDEDRATATTAATTATTAASTTVPTIASTQGVPATTAAVTAPVTTGAENVVDERVAFLVAFMNDPTAVTDDDLAAQFAPAFLAAIPPADLRAAVVEAVTVGTAPWTVGDSDLSASGGAIVMRSTDEVDLTLVFELDATSDRRIVYAQLLPGSMRAIEEAFAQPGTFDEVDAALDAVAGRVVYSVFDASDGNCAVLRDHNGDTAAPTGSSFKLWVLATLARAVRDGDAAWDETVEIDAALRSSPDGEIYPLADGTSVSLQELAEVMIAVSDNTATDHLIARLGRPAIEATMAELGVSTTARNTPFLSTGELFKMKFVDPSLGDRFLALDDPEERRSFLDDEVAAMPLPWVDDPAWTGDPALLTRPQRIDELEWFATPLDLCTTLNDLDVLASRPGLEPVAAILEQNPGLPFPEGQWQTVRFKGGSEPGVVMFAYWLEAPGGEHRVVVVSLSDPDVAFTETDAAVPVARLLGLVPTLE